MKVERSYNRHYLNNCPFTRMFKKQISDGVVTLQGTGVKVTYDGTNLELHDSEDVELFSEIIENLDKYYKKPRPAHREKYRELIDFSSFPNSRIIYVGNCDLPSKNGWNGSANAVWDDNNNPAKINEIYFKYTVNTNLSDNG